MTRKIRSDQEKKLARRNVKYELNILNTIVEAKLKHLCLPKEERDASIGSAFMDSILLHVRNLFDFLEHPPASDYVRAKDILQDKWKPPKFKIINNNLMKEINNYRMHITYSRKMGEEKPDWDIKKMRDEINAAYQEFRKELPDPDRPLWKIQSKKS
ncbi:MAG: hypothetical protein A2315_06470 [Ignavibacteria bacterium RIFOXYB2_FULL_35_12]|nr:MAG: hypothetical protein A2058_00225 [Ignavibacteria bacterium GWA2_36_19]OGU51886.1 MAG: hypothetical protein A2006_01800 [Ignavibacteria bacterium GWC2_35_8]OGU57568.1 MAG: hypothetical protein A2X60_00520 [Ignavibacteria bacterium GWF2_35_20]OGU82160.1 MAG: hypothetical protein A2254_08170 [Ignavibacteria bacterium RIFOXYA2_FULL_35_9]OGU87670.1 MAG: hypothetical protein A2492_07775 [Ignavibacteria bacterium RIFOXYC12_FULL_35_11]OGU90956.1 MAG: hypothetical protein A3K31_08460 [Ignavibac